MVAGMSGQELWGRKKFVGGLNKIWGPTFLGKFFDLVHIEGKVVRGPEKI